MEDLLRASFAVGLYYCPQTKELSKKVIMPGFRIESSDTWAGDMFANIYSNILRLPLDQYDFWYCKFFVK